MVNTSESIKGRQGLKIPVIDQSYAKLEDIERFLGEVHELNEDNFSVIYSEKKAFVDELLVPPSANKPLTILRTASFSGCGREGHYPEGGSSQGEVLTYPKRLGGAAIFLGYRDTWTPSAIDGTKRHSLNWVKFKNEDLVPPVGKKAARELASASREEIDEFNDHLVREVVQTALHATTELLTN